MWFPRKSQFLCSTLDISISQKPQYPTAQGVFCQFPFRWIYNYGSNKSTGKETGKMHFCALLDIIVEEYKEITCGPLWVQPLLKKVAFIAGKKNPAIQKFYIHFSIENLIANISFYALSWPKLNFGCYLTFEIIFKFQWKSKHFLFVFPLK